MFALYYCTFLFRGFLGFARNDSSPATAGGGATAGLSPRTTSASAGLHLQAALVTHASNIIHISAYGIPRLRLRTTQEEW